MRSNHVPSLAPIVAVCSRPPRCRIRSAVPTLVRRKDSAALTALRSDLRQLRWLRGRPASDKSSIDRGEPMRRRSGADAGSALAGAWQAAHPFVEKTRAPAVGSWGGLSDICVNAGPMSQARAAPLTSTAYPVARLAGLARRRTSRQRTRRRSTRPGRFPCRRGERETGELLRPPAAPRSRCRRGGPRVRRMSVRNM
jgi:hypothetical protein